MNAETLLSQAQKLQPFLQECRRDIHAHPEVGFDLKRTKEKVRKELINLGYDPQDCGKCGLVALAKGKKPGKTILIRADMDALPIKEEADVEYASQTEGKMHGCGHDMHTAMLLGAAALLKKYEDELEGCVKLMFQPAEEIFQGSDDMIQSGVLENPHVDAAYMIHVVAGMPVPYGCLMVPPGGTGMAGCQQYLIVVKGKGGHGARPEIAIDPITAAAHIHIALQEINSRELNPSEFGVFTTGMFKAGEASNIIPDTAEMRGTIRTGSVETNEHIKTRIEEIAKGVGQAFRCEVEVEFFDFCPPMFADDELSRCAEKYGQQLLGQACFVMKDNPKVGGGSEDFAFVAAKVPAVGMFLSAGNSNEGYIYSQHHPMVRFDDSILYRGSASLAWLSFRWLQDHQ